MAISYMVKKAQNNKIVFTSAADIADYHLRKKLDMQEAYFFQQDYYFGYHNGVLPGNVPNMVEADTLDYLAVVSDKSMSPVYFFDYKSSWDFDSEDTAKRNIFAVIPSFSEDKIVKGTTNDILDYKNFTTGSSLVLFRFRSGTLQEVVVYNK